MRRSFTAVVEQGNAFAAGFETEPFEAGWAREARWFVRFLERAEDTTLEIEPQISPDGLVWCGDGARHAPAPAPELLSFTQREFGNWLRLRVRLGGPAPHVKVVIYLALKE
jgi:hypothetical protein